MSIPFLRATGSRRLARLVVPLWVGLALLTGCHPATEKAGGHGSCGDPATLVSEVQGSGPVSPLAGRAVTVEAVVTGTWAGAAGLGGFFVQEDDADVDGDPATSEGLFVFQPDPVPPVRPGNRVRVTGVVAETNGLSSLERVAGIVGCGRGLAISPGRVELPVPSAYPDNDAYLEQFEGMVVRFAESLTVTGLSNLFRYGQVELAAGGRVIHSGQDGRYPPTPAGLENATDEFRRRTVILDDGDARQNVDPVHHPQPGGFSVDNALRGGATVSGLTGVLDYRFDAWRVQPLPGSPPAFRNPPRPEPPARTGPLRVGALNVLNYFNGDGLGGGFPTARGAHSPAEFRRQTDKLVTAVIGLDADVLGLLEVENDGDASHDALAVLVRAINERAGKGIWAAVPAGRSGGDDQIKASLIYRTDRVAPVGPAALLADRSFTDPLGHGESRNRPALKQVFRAGPGGGVDAGETFAVVVVHLKSKGSPCGPRDDSPVQGNCNHTRTEAARRLLAWLAGNRPGERERVLIIGDFNSYRVEEPMNVFTRAGFVNVLPPDAHTYAWGGRFGALDHVLASPALAPAVTGAAVWHINADESALLDYNDAVADPGERPYQVKPASRTLYRPNPWRSSDHDPVVVDLNPARTVAGAPDPLAADH